LSVFGCQFSVHGWCLFLHTSCLGREVATEN
jgi:hypothetical protein